VQSSRLSSPDRRARIVILDDFGGPVDADAETRAEASAIRLDTLIRDLLTACREPDAEIQSNARAVRRLALSAAEAAAVAHRNDLAPLAVDLCALLDGWIDRGCWRPRAVTVLAEGLALLFLDPSLAPADRARLLAELAAMTPAIVRSTHRAA
jgi:hypothetical protein